jgi:hypothetical protein
MDTVGNIKALLAVHIVWIKAPGKPEWAAVLGDQECRLRMNDFPEEPLYTLMWNDQTLDMDDVPACWIIPRA